MPLKNAFPLVAPYKQTLPAITLSSDWNVDDLGGKITISPPERPYKIIY